MSLIWDLVQGHQPAKRHGMHDFLRGRTPDRRRSSRSSLYVPVFVYGYNSSSEPFHEETNTLEVSANGALLHLDGANVHHGQKLLLMNRVTKEEQECTVVSLSRLPRHTELRVGVALSKAAPEFWKSKK